MKKIVLNISDITYEKFRFESIFEEKDIQNLIIDRVFFKPFPEAVEDAFANWMNEEIEKIIKE